MARLSHARRSRVVLRHGLFAAVLVAGAWGCALVAGVDFDAARLSTDPDGASGSSSGDPPKTGTADGGTDPARCGAEQKVCSGTCVGKADPEYGCGRPDCTPCSLSLSTGSACAPDGGCIPKGCAPGFDDCDGDPANGCETDLSRPESCGSCKAKCSAGELCSPTGCVTSCTAPLVACGGACVDPQKSVAHCGGCDKPCPPATNADPACVNGTCQIACRTGFADCKSTPPKACAALPKWYVDGDGDGFGTSAFTTACTQPAGHAPNSGDCLDTNVLVHPGAGALSIPFDGPSGPSFDYDCSGAETEDPPVTKYPGSCGPNCDQTGYKPAVPARTGPGVNNYCGSKLTYLCINFSGCGQGDYDSGIPVFCK